MTKECNYKKYVKDFLHAIPTSDLMKELVKRDEVYDGLGDVPTEELIGELMNRNALHQVTEAAEKLKKTEEEDADLLSALLAAFGVSG